MRFPCIRWRAAATFCLAVCSAAYAGGNNAASSAKLTVEPGHPWTPPFGLERVGRPLDAVVEVAASAKPNEEYVLVCYRDGREIRRQTVPFLDGPKHFGRVTLDDGMSEVALLVKTNVQAKLVEVARTQVKPMAFEADATARPEQVTNPVDLGAILPPADWLLLAEGDKGTIDMAAICRTADMPEVRVAAWFHSAPSVTTTATTAMMKDRRVKLSLPLPAAPLTVDHDVLHVGIGPAGGAELWHKNIETMVVHHRPAWPAFGAVETKLRYDAPISVRKADGQFIAMDYATAWDPKRTDVVVLLPNSSRFVFWRGSSYIPFWAGRHNTGACYEWAEREPPKDATDAVEPLMDKELRYSHVEVVESTPARVHVRWSYQSCDLKYKTWGDSAVEDFYFYPDGFGTRVLTLRCDPKANYEVDGLIVLTPQSAYPFDVLPSNMVDLLYVDGQKRALTFPFYTSNQQGKMTPRNMPAIYRIRMHKNETAAAIYFSPWETNLPEGVYGHFTDRGQIVTPVYWGSHWPLARGNVTGGAINDRFSLTPAHNSIMTWGYKRRPTPLRSATAESLDALGRSRPMLVQSWAWLIGMTDAGDDQLLGWAKSYGNPPALAAQGAVVPAQPYAPDRRALCLKVKSREVTVDITPSGRCVNPVFELADAPRKLVAAKLDNQVLPADRFRWDGATLWLKETLDRPATLKLQFAGAEYPR
jgi:hypothetical protein